MTAKPENCITLFPHKNTIGSFHWLLDYCRNYGLWFNKSLWFFHVLFIMIIFANEHNFYEFWGGNTNKKLIEIHHGHMNLTSPSISFWELFQSLVKNIYLESYNSLIYLWVKHENILSLRPLAFKKTHWLQDDGTGSATKTHHPCITL